MKEGGYEDCMATFDSNHNTIYASFSKVQSLRTLGHNDQKSERLDVRLDCVKGFKKTRKTVEIDFFFLVSYAPSGFGTHDLNLTASVLLLQ